MRLSFLLLAPVVAPVVGLISGGSRDLIADSRNLQPAETNLMDAHSRFHRASSGGLSKEEKTIERALSEAMSKSPSTVGRPVLNLTRDVEVSCLPDVARCPKHWVHESLTCKATASYVGVCAPSTAWFDLSVEARLAFARYCQAELHCQGDCPQNFEAVCPSLWNEISPNVCAAPRGYVGSCPHRVRTDAMTKEDKFNFGLKCGARWPCALPPDHVYTDVCPESWTLHFGQTCIAPREYRGPCGRFVRLGGSTKSNKQALEAACGISWPSKKRCEKDYSASCPVGWQERIKAGKTFDCVAPSEYRGCSRVQAFEDFTPVEKQRWERNCGQHFPCHGESRPNVNQATQLSNGPVLLMGQEG